MVDAVTAVTVAGVTILFFFWAYGIYAFVRDLRRVLPVVLENVREWRRGDEESEPEHADQEQYLY